MSVLKRVPHPASVSVRDALLVLSFIGAAVLGVPSLLRGLFHLSQGALPIDLAQFYLSGYIFRTAPGASFYDPLVLLPVARDLGINFQVSNYPPLVAILFYPFSFLPYAVFKPLWLAANLALTLAVPFWAARRMPAPRSRRLALLVWFIALLPATIENLLLGQINAPLGWLLVLVDSLAQRRRRTSDLTAAAVLGLAQAVKLWPLLLAGYFLLRRRWTIASFSLLVFAALTLTSAAVVGPEISQQYFTNRMPGSGFAALRPTDAINQSMWAAATRFFVGGSAERARLSPDNTEAVSIPPLLDSPALYGLFTAGYVLAAAAALLTAGLKTPSFDPGAETRLYWAFILAVLTVLPFSWPHYAFLLTFPLVSLLQDGNLSMRSISWIAVLCLLLTLVFRYWAWLPASPLILAGVFLAQALMGVALLRSLIHHRPGPARLRLGKAR